MSKQDNNENESDGHKEDEDGWELFCLARLSCPCQSVSQKNQRKVFEDLTNSNKLRSYMIFVKKSATAVFEAKNYANLFRDICQFGTKVRKWN